MSPSSSLHGNSGALAPGDGSTDVPSARNHTLQSTSTRRRIGAASAAVALLAATGLLLTVVGVLIWLVWPPRKDSPWKTEGVLPRRRGRPSS